MGPNPPLPLTESERAGLLRWMQLPSTSQAVALRCRIVLACSEGRSNTTVARECGVSPPVVGKWRARFREGRLAALRDRPRSGAPRSVTDERVHTVLEATLAEPPPNGSRWTKRDMAARTGVSPSSVVRIWQRLGITPPARRRRTRSAVGDPWSALYVAPPESIMVLAVDGNIGPEVDTRSSGSPASENHDALLRKELAATLSQRAATDAVGNLLDFLRSLELRAFGEHEIHLICHGHGARKIEAIRQWQEQHTELHLHFAPSKEFWLRLVERHFAPLITRNAVPGETPLPALARALRSWTGAHPRKALTWFHP